MDHYPTMLLAYSPSGSNVRSCSFAQVNDLSVLLILFSPVVMFFNWKQFLLISGSASTLMQAHQVYGVSVQRLQVV